MPPFRRSPSYESKKGNEKNLDFKELHGARWNPCGFLTSTFFFFFSRAFWTSPKRKKCSWANDIIIVASTIRDEKKEKERKTRACHTEQTGRRMVIC